MEWPRQTRTPAAASCAMNPGGTSSGARVTTVQWACGAHSSAASASSGRRIIAGSCTPGLPGDRNGPSKWMPSTPGLAGADARTASSAARILAGVSVISVGSSAVVPNFRCAATMAAMPSGVGSSLNRTSPPPLTCTSMNPGASHAPSGSVRVGIPAGTSPRAMTPAMRAPSITTAQSRCTVSPSKTVPASTAWGRAPLIVSG